jgi:hypothetical protein
LKLFSSYGNKIIYKVIIHVTIYGGKKLREIKSFKKLQKVAKSCKKFQKVSNIQHFWLTDINVVKKKVSNHLSVLK